jgi:hypothetical protein
VEYAYEIDEVYTNFVVDYDNDGGPVGDSSIMSDTYVPNWVEPPDLHFILGFPRYKQNLDNSWSREGSGFAKSGETIAAVNSVRWEVLIHDPWSVRQAKIFNPFGYTLRVDVWSCDSAKAESTQMMLLYIQPQRSVEVDLAQLIEEIRNDGDEYLKFECWIYDEAITDNYILVDSTNEIFYLGFPDTDPKYGIPIGPSIALDVYNVIDRYGLAIAGIAGVSQAVAMQVGALKADSSIGKIASGMGISVATLAGILGLGLGYNWITYADMQEFVLPAVMGLGSAALGTYMVNRMPNKYLGLAGTALAGTGNAATAMVIMMMIDDMRFVAEV